jgi:hypothetical protein
METGAGVVYNAVVWTSVPSWVADVPIQLLFGKLMSGGLAQLGEHYVRNVGVGGSTPLPSTTIPRRSLPCQV